MSNEDWEISALILTTSPTIVSHRPQPWRIVRRLALICTTSTLAQAEGHRIVLYTSAIPPDQSARERTFLAFLFRPPCLFACDSLLSTSLFRDRAPYDACILVEPAMWTEDLVGQNTPFLDMAILSLPKRRQHWKNWEDMQKYIRSRMPWNMWDQRALDLYLVSPLPATLHLPCSPPGMIRSSHSRTTTSVEG